MNDVEYLPLPYRANSCEYFAALRALPGVVFLDSAQPFAPMGRFDILAADPVCRIETHAGRTRITDANGIRTSDADPFQLVEDGMARHAPPVAHAATIGEWPFLGGAIGYFAYDLARAAMGLPALTTTGRLADMRVGIYRWAVLQDHQAGRATLVCDASVASDYRNSLVQRLLEPPTLPTADFVLDSDFSANMDEAGYGRAYERVARYIRDGDCYQVNLAQRLSADFHGDPWVAYQQLRARMASPFSAYLEANDGCILSFSPERFLHLREGLVETRPIKGTIRRGATPALDAVQQQRLLASEKDRAENIMIVDLLRNDLSKSCRHGSVRVEQLCALESYANVHHLVSVVKGQLREDRSPLDLLRGCFPGGSITGAPKRRAMQIIAELEPDARSIYCGSVGYVSRHGEMDTNIAIRTLATSGTQIHCWGGGGVVADSDRDTEYRETLTKVAPLIEGLMEFRC